MISGEQIQRGHILKFVAKGRTFDPNVGIRTFPRQTYGVSDESPDQFKGKHTLIGEHSYIYKYENANEFEYPSQRKYFNVHQSIQQGDPAQVSQRLLSNSLAFHRKKGRLSEFMDKNGWMSPVMPIMGFERTEDARNLSNRDRQKRISSLKPPKKPKVSPEYYKTISIMMSQKLRIRKKRQELMKAESPVKFRTIKGDQYNDPIQIENVEQKMAKTTNDFYSTSSTFYNRGGTSQLRGRALSSKQSNFPSRISSRLQQQKQSSPLSKRSPSPNTSRAFSPSKQYRGKEESKMQRIQQSKQPNMNLEQWYKSTCNSKWVYNPKQLDTQERQEVYVNIDRHS